MITEELFKDMIHMLIDKHELRIISNKFTPEGVILVALSPSDFEAFKLIKGEKPNE